ncbi:MAG TPA: hypothetical protein VJ808_03470 [Gemmatimonadales bacterium]|nr:hypothetical protein [Gemmatimonadales bacterium]
MPAEIVARAVSMSANAAAQLPDFLNELISGHGCKIIVHNLPHHHVGASYVAAALIAPVRSGSAPSSNHHGADDDTCLTATAPSTVATR